MWGRENVLNPKTLIIAGLFGSVASLVGSFLAFLFLMVSPAFVVVMLGITAASAIGQGVGTVFCDVTSCQGPVVSSWNTPAVQAVTVTWLGLEEQTVNYYCTRAAERHEPCLDLPFVQAIMMQESGGDPNATSSAGAIGLMQVMPSHFSQGQNPYDPLTNLMVGVRYLDSLDVQFQGNSPLVAAGYNAGGGEVQYWVQTFGTSSWDALSQIPDIQGYAGGQTYAYVNDVMSYYDQFRSTSTGPGQGLPQAAPR